MYGIQIELTARAEFHEPKSYEHFPAVQIEVFIVTGPSPEKRTLVIHRCEDIQGLSPAADRGEALIAAREWLNDVANYKAFTEALISHFGE